MKYLIINADDFGLTPEINQGIVECFQNGVVTNASLVVNEAASRDAALLAKDAKLPLGIHLNLFSGEFLHADHFFGPRGKLRGCLSECEERQKNNIFLSFREIRSVRREFQHQIQIFCDLFGALPNHVSYHLGLHVVPQLIRAFMESAEAFDLPFRIRNEFCRKIQYHKHPDTWIDRFHGEGLSRELFLTILDEVPEGITEISAHPGYRSRDLDDPYNDERETELQILSSPDLKATIRSKGIILTDYSILQ